MAAICPKMLPVAAVFAGLHICHRVSSLPKPHRVGYVTTSTLLLASSPATYSTDGRSLPCAPKTIWHHCQFFSCISPRNSVLVFRNKFAETITCLSILSGGCELSHGFAVIDLSLEQPARAQGFLDTVCTEIARPICL